MRILQSERVDNDNDNNNNRSAICIVDNGGWTVKFGLIPTNNGAVGDTTATTAATATDAAASSSPTMVPSSSSMYNATARPPHQLAILAGDEITAHMKNLGQLAWKHPMERGMVCDGETQIRVWNRMLEVAGVIPAATTTTTTTGGAAAGFSRGKKPPAAGTAATASPTARRRTTADVSPRDCTFLLLEPPFVPSAITEGVDCILFRELGLGRVARSMGPCMAAMRYVSFCRSSAAAPATNASTTSPPRDRDGGSSSSSPPSSSAWSNDDTNCCCVVDSGYSFTHVVPTHDDGVAVVDAIRRLDLGGKALTNLLKEFVTYRQWNMMDEYHIVNDVKERLCFVSDRFDAEMAEARNTRRGMRWFDREYLLPDFVDTFRGTVRLPEPLQRKRELEEMERMKLDLERGEAEEKRRKLMVEEARELSKDEEAANEEVGIETDEKKGDGSRKLREADQGKSTDKDGGIHPQKEAKKKMRRPIQVGSLTADGAGEEGDAITVDDTISDSDSDDETDQQRLHRLKAMRDAERKRREQESLDRQALAMSVERFAIPEVLFRPSDIGLDCGGIADAIVESITACPPTVRAAMYHNILLVGGNAKIPGFRDRVESDLRKLAPTNYEVRVYLPEDPVSYAWEGAKQFAQRAGFREQFSIDRASWEAMKKSGKNQQEIWGNKKMMNSK